MKQLYLVLFLIINLKSYSCDCPQIDQKTYLKGALKNYDMIFFGELIRYDTINMTYEFRIIEQFKGNYKYKTIRGFSENSSCSIFPKIKGHWLIFSKLINNKVSLDGCNPSYAYGNQISMLPFFKFSNLIGKNKNRLTKIDSLESEIDLVNQRLIAIENWNIDLERLKQYKIDKSKQINNKKEKDYLLYFVVCLNFIVIIVLYIKYNKKIF